MPETRLQYLMGQYYHNLATSPEIDELMALVVLPENEKAIESILDEGWKDFSGVHMVFTKDQGQAVLDHILSTKRTSKPGGKRWPYWRWSAAAAIALMLAGGAYIYMSSRKTIPVTKATLAAASDVPPGVSKAVLTLASGQRIILDSAATGTIAFQGSTAIDKVAGGGLSYKEGNHTSGTVLLNTLTTPRGGQYMLRLPDGSRVWLDAASSITYPTAFTGKERRVKITGQAYLEIVHHASMPFITEVNGTEIKDIGTAFNINAYDDEAAFKITLVSGSVAIGGPAEKVVLQPRQQLKVTGSQWQVLDHADMKEVLAWKNGKFLFGEKADIATIMRQLARWYDVDVQYQGQVRAHFGGGISRQVNISKVLEKLSLTGEVNFKIDGKTIIVTP
jgi:hypothetical protein